MQNGIKKEEKMQKLSECEELVMAFIWGQDEAQDMSTIMRAVNKKHGKEWKPQTVSTFLTRLVRKEYLASERKGGIHIIIRL